MQFTRSIRFRYHHESLKFPSATFKSPVQLRSSFRKNLVYDKVRVDVVKACLIKVSCHQINFLDSPVFASYSEVLKKLFSFS